MPGAILSAHLKSAIRNYAFLFAGCVLFHAVGTLSLPLVDRDEPRFAEASREMIQRGDYIVPYFNDHLRLDKPPLTYWAQAASYRLFGENDFAARFPSAIAAALVALSILAWGTRLGGNNVGWWAAIIFTLSLQTFLHAKAAVADMWLVLFVTLAHWAGYELLRDSLGAQSHVSLVRPAVAPYQYRTLWWWVFYLSLAFGFLAKGPIGWVPLLTILSTKFFLAEPKLSYRFQFPFGSLFMLAILALWGIPAVVRTHGQFFVVGIGRHVVGRSFASMEGHGANSFGMRGGGDHFHHFQFDQNKIAALHVASLSPDCALARAQGDHGRVDAFRKELRVRVGLSLSRHRSCRSPICSTLLSRV